MYVCMYVCMYAKCAFVSKPKIEWLYRTIIQFKVSYCESTYGCILEIVYQTGVCEIEEIEYIILIFCVCILECPLFRKHLWYA